ncbi:MAG: M16 family metallopeptidase [Bacteroidales bacterium]
MNRSKAPTINNKIDISLTDHVVVKLQNSVPVHIKQAGSQPVVRIDMVFRAGSWWQPKTLVASTTNAMLSEGTLMSTGEEIANKLDYYGSYLNSSADRDNAFISLYSLTKHLDVVLPQLAEIIKNPSFPEIELQTYLNRRLQSHITEKVKVTSIAREKFAMNIYGSRHPYGQVLSVSDFSRISREDLVEFHKQFYSSGNCNIIVTGNFDETTVINNLEALFGNNDWSSPSASFKKKVIKRSSTKKQVFIPKKDAIQSAVRVGRELFNKKHPDYCGMQVLNNILGGHFGSRLMQNIREKKGYTYGIGSAMVGLRNSGFLVIVSEVDTGYWAATIKEIYRELDKLCDKPVSGRELELTRSQMIGETLRGFDGPFAWAESIRNLIEYDLDHTFHQKMISVIRNISPRELQNLAIKYLPPEKMYEVVSGG